MGKAIGIVIAAIVYVVCAIVFVTVYLTTDDEGTITLAGYFASSTITVVTLIAAVFYLKTSPSEEYREKYMKDEEEKE